MNARPGRIIDGHFHSHPGGGGWKRQGPEHFEAIFEDVPELECVVTSSIVASTGRQAAASDDTQAVIDAVGPERVKGSVWVIPHAPEWREDAARRLDAGFVAIKLHAPLGGYKLSVETAGPVMELARERAVPVTFHFSDPEGLDGIAREFPGVTMVLFHSGSLAGMKLARKHPNIVLETSVADNFLIEVLVRMIGAERVMYGCDAPLCMAARRHAAELGVKPYAANLDEICALELSPGELATICREVSARVYGLEAAR